MLVVTGGDGSYYPTPTETLEVGVDSYWSWHYDTNAMDVSCANADNNVYCLQGKLSFMRIKISISYYYTIHNIILLT